MYNQISPSYITLKRFSWVTTLLIIFIFHVNANTNDSVIFQINAGLSLSKGSHAPFWLQNNQNSKISHQTNSANTQLIIFKEFQHPERFFDYSYKSNILFQSDSILSHLYFQELYANFRLSAFHLLLGAKEEHIGNQDSTLSSGGLIFSNNYRPIPRIWAGIENFSPIPFTFGLIEVKGGISHGQFTDNIYAKNAFVHQKNAYIRIGGRKSPIQLQYGLDHGAQWGGFLPGIGQQPNTFEDFKRVFLAKSGGSDALKTEQINTLGNHIISQSTRLDLNLKNWHVAFYWQNISEDGPIYPIWKTMNVYDGLWGCYLENKHLKYINKVLFEYLNTTDQSGPFHDKDGIIYGGADSYFTNSVYKTGWTYYGRSIGNPLITSPIYITNSNGEIINNRVQAHHFGLEGQVSSYNYKVLTTFTKNYGNYFLPFTEMKTQNFYLLDISKKFNFIDSWACGLSVGVDVGELYGNNWGVFINLSKVGILFK